ncbi:MAG TPA: hypothetical protein PKN75_14740 [Bacteroidia bacterium]|nr:hypothetical protein [Bacteroidia bacterium]HNU34843.1 hypothetical protein [Bacteroidia bacterium]
MTGFINCGVVYYVQACLIAAGKPVTTQGICVRRGDIDMRNLPRNFGGQRLRIRQRPFGC